MMHNKKFLALLLAIVMLTVPLVSAGAASSAETPALDGTIQSCVTATDAFTNDIIVVCEVNLAEGGTQTVRLSVDDAVTLGLAILNEDGTVTIIATENQEVSIDPDQLLADPCAVAEGATHPLSKILADFFCGTLGLSYDTIQTIHEDGFGFGEIAQACFMAEKLGGPGNLCEQILYAKKSGDYSGLTLPSGITVSNWGQLKKAILHDGPASTTNLGSVVSGQAKNNGQGKDKVHENNGRGKSNEEHGKPKK